MNLVRPIALIIAFSSTISCTKAASVAAQSADEFVDSIGVNVHAFPPYTDQHDLVKTRLGELGVRHLRDGDNEQALRYAEDLFVKFGIKTTFLMGRRIGGPDEWKSPLDLAKIDVELSEIKKLAGAATEALEGPNEYDIHSDKRDVNWAATLRGYQQQLYAKAKSDPALKSLPVIAPSLTSAGAYSAVGDLDAAIDRSCVHLYQSTRNPGTPGWGDNGYGSIRWMFDFIVTNQSPSRKIVWSTECGYNSELPERVEAKYLPRMFAEFYRNGIERSFKYELLGNQWGLLRDDGSPKPAFMALRNLIALLKDPGPSFAPTELDFDLVSKIDDVRTLVLQKRDGTFYIVLWREVSGWDVNQKKELRPPSQSLTLCVRQSSRQPSIRWMKPAP